MGAYLARLLRFFDDHLPHDARLDEEERRRGRTGLSFAAVFLTQAPVFALVCALVDMYVAAAFVALTGVAVALSPWVMQRSLVWGNRYVLGWLWVVLQVIGYHSGGPRAPALAWMAALPVMATMTGSVREGTGWLVSIAVMPLFLTLGELLGVQYPPMSSLPKTQLWWVVAITMMMCVMFALAVTYEATRAAMVRAIKQANDGMRLVLDNVEQGFVTVGRGGKMSGMRSAVIDTWLGPPRDGDAIADWVERAHAPTGGWLRMGLEEVFEGVLPVEVTLGQLPKRFSAADRLLELDYRPVFQGPDLLQAVVVIVSDVTERAQAERAETTQRELMSVFGHLVRDRAGVLQFFEEAAEIVAQLERPGPSSLRLVHTLKGNAGIFGLKAVAAVCHEVESAAQDEKRMLEPEELARVRTAWGETLVRVAPLLADETETLGVVEDDLVALEQTVLSGAPDKTLLRMLQELRHERAAQIFARLGERASALGKRIGRCAVTTEVRDHGLRFSPAIWAPVWAAMVHAVRNSVDHGGEETEARIAQGKSADMHLTFESVLDDTGLLVIMSDDGAGIDWARVREKAERLGLPHETPEDLHEALFCDGLSTRDAATELSGRGVGLSALREACAAIGATVRIRSRPGQGTRLEIRAPHPRRSLRASA